MLKYIKLYFNFLRINLANAMIHRGDFFFGIATVMLESVTVYISIVVLFNHIHSIGSWSYEDMLVLSGTFMFTHALAWLLYKSSLTKLDRKINSGDLDWYLVKPIDTQFLATVHRIDLEDAARGLVGLVIVALGLVGRDPIYTLAAVPVFFSLLLLGQVFLYAVTLSVKTISFKSVEGWAGNAIFVRFHDLARYPTDIYTGIARTIFTFFLPLIFVATVPAKAFVGGLSLPLFLGACLCAAVSFFISRQIWLFALGRYSSASS